MATGFETLLFNGNIHPNLKNLSVEVESERDRKKVTSSKFLVLQWLKDITALTGLLLLPLKVVTHVQDTEQDITEIIKPTSGTV